MMKKRDDTKWEMNELKGKREKQDEGVGQEAWSNLGLQLIIS